jgi:hypothetical protein
MRGRRECRVFRCTRSLVCDGRKHTSVVTADEAETPTFPARWFYRLWRALPGVHDLVVTVVSRNVSRDLAPAQGCQNHTLLLYAHALHVRQCVRVHRIPPHDRDDAFAPLHRGGTIAENHVFMKFGRRIFCAGGAGQTRLISDSQNLICPSGKSVAGRADRPSTTAPGQQNGLAPARQRGIEVARAIHGLQLFAAKKDHSGGKTAAS